MTNINDQNYIIDNNRQMRLNYGPIYPYPYTPLPQVPVLEPIPERFYINTYEANPFTIKPINTEWNSNELLLRDPLLRVSARVSMADIGMKQASNYVSPQHLNPGWKWCGGYDGCEIRS